MLTHQTERRQAYNGKSEYKSENPNKFKTMKSEWANDI